MGKHKLRLDLNPMALNPRKSNPHKIIVLVNRMVRKIFRPNMEEAKGIQINQPTRCNNFSSLSLDVHLQFNMFRASSRPSSGAQQRQQQPLVLPSERGDSSAVGCGRVGIPETATAVVELLMMGVRTPETC